MWTGENFGIALKALAQKIEPNRPALIYGEDVITWSDFDERTDRIAAALSGMGFAPGDIAGQMLRNTPDYLLSYFGCIKAGLVPLNVNYHYSSRELIDIFQRFGVKAVFTHDDLRATAEGSLPKGATVFDVDAPEWIGLQATELPVDFEVHSDPNSLFLTATGGTTGMPKAVMWPMIDAWQAFNASVWPRGNDEPPFVASSLSDQVSEATRLGPDHPQSASPLLLLSPLMHAAGQFTAIIHLLKGGTLALLPSKKFDADLALDELKRVGARRLFFIGDAFAAPLVSRLDARDDGVEVLSSLGQLISSGAIFSSKLKQRFFEFAPNLVIMDALGSSESSGTAVIVTTAAGSMNGGRFMAVPGRETKLFDKDLREIPQDSDDIGIVGRTGPLPLGYLGEDAKNQETFPEINGRRWLITGDSARWGADGTLEFIGRDNMCINTGGEKVFPEEVEAVLLEHPSVNDVRVVSVPDARFGRKIVAVVQPHGEVTEEALDQHARSGMAGYKIPRVYFMTDQSLRLNNGKPDYVTAQNLVDAHYE